MIEINLIPDVKQEYLHAKKIRNTVISGAIIAGVVSVTAVVLLAVYSFGAQPLRSQFADKQIDERFEDLKRVEDLDDMLTVQSQLSSISTIHNTKKVMSSRLFEVLTAINPSGEDSVSYSNVRLDVKSGTIQIDAQAKRGYVAAEAFEKTILETKMSFMSNGETVKEPVALEVTQSNQSYGEDANGDKVLRFTINFEFNELLFSPSISNVTIERPFRQDATDSHRRVPESLFSARATDEGSND